MDPVELVENPGVSFFASNIPPSSITPLGSSQSYGGYVIVGVVVGVVVVVVVVVIVVVVGVVVIGC